MRCLCVVCCQQEAFGEADKVLLGKRLKWYKVSVDNRLNLDSSVVCSNLNQLGQGQKIVRCSATNMSLVACSSSARTL